MVGTLLWNRLCLPTLPLNLELGQSVQKWWPALTFLRRLFCLLLIMGHVIWLHKLHELAVEDVCLSFLSYFILKLFVKSSFLLLNFSHIYLEGCLESWISTDWRRNHCAWPVPELLPGQTHATHYNGQQKWKSVFIVQHSYLEDSMLPLLKLWILWSLLAVGQYSGTTSSSKCTNKWQSGVL